ncbi:MFS transporter [Paenibacillus sp. SN-8-1]|uniref:MFS transporter n=1 Tax=Paenibacillus sp. SN-8-1 TaxID=3435409 RepID=UPI003D9A472D
MESRVNLSNPLSQTDVVSRTLVTFTFLLGIFMGALDHGIVGPALSSIMNTFNISASWGVWSFTVYTLIFAVSIPVIGKMSDRVGRKQAFLFGIIMFGIGSLIAAFAPNFIVFLLGRAVQAIGSGGIFPITAAQIAMSYPPEHRDKAMGWIGVAFGLGSILGPTVGGFIIATASWKWIFLVNIPVCALILLLIAKYKPNQTRVVKPIDVLGITLLTLLILAVMLGIRLQNFWLIALGVICIPLLLLVEKKHPDPIMKVKYFTRSRTLALLLASAASGFVMATAVNFIPLFAEMNLGLAKGSSGFAATPLAIASMAASLIGGMLTDRLGARRALMAGFGLALIGAVFLILGMQSIVLLILTIILMGLGIGIIIGSPLNVLMLQAVEPSDTGMAVGYLSLFRSLGSTVGPALAGVFIANFTNGFSPLFITSAALSLASMAIVLVSAKGR